MSDNHPFLEAARRAVANTPIARAIADAAADTNRFVNANITGIAANLDAAEQAANRLAATSVGVAEALGAVPTAIGTALNAINKIAR